MNRNKQQTAGLSWILSPRTLYTVATLFSVALVAVPSSFYEAYVREEYFVAGNASYFLFFVGAFAVFVLGTYAAETIGGRRPRPGQPNEASWTSFCIGVVALVGNLGLHAKLYVELGQVGMVEAILLQGYDKQAFNAAMAETSLGWVFPVSVLALSLIWWRLLAGSAESGLARKKDLWPLFCAVVAAFFVTNLLSHGRGVLVWLVLTLFVVWFVRQAETRRVSGRRVMLGGVLVVGFVVAIFFAFQYSRVVGVSTEPMSRATEEFIGYFLGGFNRFAAMLEGELVLPFSGQGYYLGQFLWHMPGVGGLLTDVGQSFGLRLPANEFEVFDATFVHIREAGLDGRYIWCTIYGWPYAELGWWSMCVWFGFGIVAQWSWRRCWLARPSWVIAYAYVFYCLLWWPAFWPFVENSVLYVLAVMLAVCGERLLRNSLVRTKEVAGAQGG